MVDQPQGKLMHLQWRLQISPGGSFGSLAKITGGRAHVISLRPPLKTLRCFTIGSGSELP